MRLQVTVRHGHVSDSVRAYVEDKFGKLDRRLHEATNVDVVLDREHNPKIANDHVVEATVRLKGPTLHLKEAATTYEAAADVLVDKLERQVERYRDKRVHEPRRKASTGGPEPLPVEAIERELHQDASRESAA
jgi:putative sigma-54 modulation protein